MSHIKSKTLTYTSRNSPLKITDEVISLPIKPGQLLIKTSHSALNPVNVKLKSIALAPYLRYAMHDFSGVVEEVGQEYKNQFKVGDRVAGFTQPVTFTGHAGTHTIVEPKSNIVFKVPAYLSDAEAAGMPLVFSTAWAMLENAKLQPGSTVLVMGGATAVGTFAIQLAKHHHGAGRIVSVNSGRSAEYVASLGADQIVDYRTQKVPEALKSEAASHGKFDAILDCVGGRDAIDIWPSILKTRWDGGAFVTVAGDVSPSDSYTTYGLRVLASLPRGVARLTWSRYVSGLGYSFAAPKAGAWVNEIPTILAKNKYKVPVDTVFKLADYQKGWDKMANGSNSGKVVFDLTDATN